jgi:glucan 1,4-alpha-glucosidase
MDRRQFLTGLTAAGGAALTGVPRATAAAAPGGPGDDAQWTTGEKYGVGTVADHGASDPSAVWFTLTEGALSEPRFPRVDLPALRTVDFLVTDGAGYAARGLNVSRTDDTDDTVERTTERVADDALLFRQTLSATDRDWTLEVEYASDPENDAILADVSFSAPGTYDVYCVVDPALSNSGYGDTGLAGEALAGFDGTGNDGDAAIRDENGDPYNLAFGAAVEGGFDWTTADFVGGDSISPLLTSGDDTTSYDEAGTGNVALAGRVGTGISSLSTTLALGFARDGDTDAAVAEAESGLARGYATVESEYVASWRDYVPTPPASVSGDLASQYRAAAMELKAVDDKTFTGAGLASPSIPWGDAVNANYPDDYGYGYVWARDLYQVFTAYLAAGDTDSAREATEYIYEYQQDDAGFIPQNTFVDGRTRWGGEQMDNISFPQVMAYQLKERAGIDFAEAGYDYENVRRSAEYVAQGGPDSAQERWEEEGGYSPSTIAAEIAGLACAASLADDEGERTDALVWLALADDWTRNVEDWCATETGTDRHTTTPYYIRIDDDRDPDDGASLAINNGGPTLDERNVIDAGFLELVRLGVLPADDPTIRNSVEVVDDTIRVETPNGPGFYRYNGDGYGEQGQNDDNGYPAGAPWSLDFTGQGRLWPILTGERAEYELRRSGGDDPVALLESMSAFGNSGEMIPEQVWDRPEPTDYGWEFGEGTGSATPLSWSMAQFVRLAHSLDAGEPVETPAFVRERYVETDLPAGPALDAEVPTTTREGSVTITGTTAGSEVVVRTPVETSVVSADADGSFAVEAQVQDGENAVTVVAATDADALLDVGTTVVRESVTRVDVGSPVAGWSDPAVDDHGPGSYTYPTADAFTPGAFDLASVEVYETADRYQFLVGIHGELTNPFGGPRGFSLQTLQFYLRDPDASGGSVTAREGVNAEFRAAHQARFVVEGFVGENPPRLEAADGSTLTSDVSVVAYGSANAIKFDAPKSAVQNAVGDLRDADLAPLLLGQDGFGTGRVRFVGSEAGAFTFGGGADDSSNPNVIDLVTPADVTQAEALASDDGPAQIPYLSVESGYVSPAVEVVSKVNPKSKGVTPVRIASDADLRRESLRLGVAGGAGAVPAHDAHADGGEAMVVHFPTQELGVSGGTETLVLTGETVDGTPVYAEVAVEVVGKA